MWSDRNEREDGDQGIDDTGTYGDSFGDVLSTRKDGKEKTEPNFPLL